MDHLASADIDPDMASVAYQISGLRIADRLAASALNL